MHAAAALAAPLWRLLLSEECFAYMGSGLLSSKPAHGAHWEWQRHKCERSEGEEAAAEEGAPPPDSAFDGGGAAGSTMGKKEDTKGESGHTQNFDKEAGREGGKAATGTKGTRQYSTLAVMHASPVSSSALHRGMQGMMGFYQRYSSSVETPHIDKEKATQDKDILRSASGGAAMEDKEPDEDPKEGTSPWGGEGEQVVHKGGDNGVGRQMGTGSATNVRGNADLSAEEANVPPDSSFDAGGSANMGEGNAGKGRQHTQNFDDEMKTKGGSKKAVN